jgi:cysteine synthase A
LLLQRVSWWHESLRLFVRNNFLQLIGWTPLIELKRIASKDGVDARIVGKMEAYQPLCSVKDRCALRLY